MNKYIRIHKELNEWDLEDWIHNNSPNQSYTCDCQQSTDLFKGLGFMCDITINFGEIVLWQDLFLQAGGFYGFYNGFLVELTPRSIQQLGYQREEL